MAAVELMLARGAAQTDSMEGATPLIIALQYHHPEIALRLLRTTPPPSVDHRVPRDGSSAMFVAAGTGAWRCIHEWERARKGLGKEWERTRKGMGKDSERNGKGGECNGGGGCSRREAASRSRARVSHNVAGVREACARVPRLLCPGLSAARDVPQVRATWP